MIDDSIDMACAITALKRADDEFKQGHDYMGKQLTLGALELISGAENWGPME